MTPAVDVLDPYYIVAETDGRDAETRVIKQGDTFAVFDPSGDIATGRAAGAVSRRHALPVRVPLRLAGQRPLLLGSTPGASSHVLTVDLTNPDIRDDDTRSSGRKGTLHIRRTTFLWDATCFVRVALTNHGLTPMALPIELSFDADFRDLFEVRGTRRAARGQMLPPRPDHDGLLFSYQGLDRHVRQTVVRIEPAPQIRDGRQLRRRRHGLPRAARELLVAVTCGGSGPRQPLVDAFRQAPDRQPATWTRCGRGWPWSARPATCSTSGWSGRARTSR